MDAPVRAGAATPAGIDAPPVDPSPPPMHAFAVPETRSAEGVRDVGIDEAHAAAIVNTVRDASVGHAALEALIERTAP